MIKFLLSILISSMPLASYAQYFKTEDFAVSLGFQAQSLNYKRGIITYGGPQVVPIVAVQLFNPDWLFAGSSLYYTRSLSKITFLRARVNFSATPDSPLYETSEDKEARPTRDKTAEFDLYLEYRAQDDSFVRVQFSQDLIAHGGSYTEVYGRLALYDFYKGPKGKAMIQPGLFAAIGAGNEVHNRYLYGEKGDDFGFTNAEYGFSVTSPEVIDVFWPTFKLTRFHFLGDGPPPATSLVEERDGWSVMLLMAFRVY